MKKYVLKQIVRVALFTVMAIWNGLLMVVWFIALASASAGQKYAGIVLVGDSLVLWGGLYIMFKIWEWKV